MERGKLIVVSGPSGVGKGTILRRLFELKQFPLVSSVSATTRAPRPGEKDGIDYYFLSQDEFQKKRENDEFLESFQVFTNGDWYGTLRKTVESALDRGDWLVLEIDTQGGRKVLDSNPDAISVFILPPNLSELEKRLTGRGTETAEARTRRLKKAEAELSECESYRYRIVNDDLDRAVREFQNILSKSCPTQDNRRKGS